MEAIFGKSIFKEAREKAERFYLAGKIDKEGYLQTIKKINQEEEFDNL